MPNTILKLVTILFAATACMAGCPSAVFANLEPLDAHIAGGG